MNMRPPPSVPPLRWGDDVRFGADLRDMTLPFLSSLGKGPGDGVYKRQRIVR